MFLLALSGCDVQPKTQPVEASRPAPHYQMVPTSDGVYVLDTISGQVAKCATTISDRTWCTPSVTATDGKGPSA